MSKFNKKASDLLNAQKNAGTEAGADEALNNTATATENAENAKAKAEKPTAYTPTEFIAWSLNSKNGTPIGAVSPKAVNLTGLKAQQGEFLNEFKAVEPSDEIKALPTHARDRAVELDLKIQVIEFLIAEKNFAKYMAKDNEAIDYTKAELKNLQSYFKNSLSNLLKYPKAVGMNEKYPNAERITLKEGKARAEQALQDEKAKNAELLARIAELEKKAGLETA